jgi:hypothetical protein
VPNLAVFRFSGVHVASIARHVMAGLPWESANIAPGLEEGAR